MSVVITNEWDPELHLGCDGSAGRVEMTMSATSRVSFNLESTRFS
jgi:hypothetical protein